MFFVVVVVSLVYKLVEIFFHPNYPFLTLRLHSPYKYNSISMVSLH